MRVKIIGHNMEITPQIRRLVKSKIADDLEKYLPQLNQEIKTADMTIKHHTRWGYKVNFDLRLPENYQIFGESHNENLKQALVGLRKKLERQIKKYRQGLMENQATKE